MFQTVHPGKSRCFMVLFMIVPFLLPAQMITGVWHGKINKQKVEVKIILQGDSLTGTSYYYVSPDNYRRYSIRGYFDARTNQAVWWDDRLLEERSGRFTISVPGKIPLVSTADFNCPGGSTMLLDGQAAKRDDPDDPEGEVHLSKSSTTTFEDEWDFIIDNFTAGTNDPEIIDSVSAISLNPRVVAEMPVSPPPQPLPVTTSTPVLQKPAANDKQANNNIQDVLATDPVMKTAAKPLTIEEKFRSRKKDFIREIPLSGDSVELRFYDNAEIDGDSISLFLNGKLFAQHIRLTAAPHIIRLAVSELEEVNELTMVAENMGSIPPNTSYMVAVIEQQRYDAYLASSEGSSAMIRLVKTK